MFRGKAKPCWLLAPVQCEKGDLYRIPNFFQCHLIGKSLWGKSSLTSDFSGKQGVRFKVHLLLGGHLKNQIVWTHWPSKTRKSFWKLNCAKVFSPMLTVTSIISSHRTMQWNYHIFRVNKNTKGRLPKKMGKCGNFEKTGGGSTQIPLLL